LSIEGHDFKWAFPDEGRIGEPVKPTRKPKCRKVTIQLDFDSDSDAEALYEAYAIINGEASKNSSLVAWYAETEDKTVRLTPVKPTRKPSFHKINVEISLDEETEQEALYEVHSTLDSFTTATCGESHFTAIFFPEWGRIGDPVEPKRYRHVA